MRFRRVGRSGLTVSVVGLGTNNFGTRMGRAESIRVVHAALDQGISLFDTADIYGGGESEALLGEALRGRRDTAIIATKFGMDCGAHGGLLAGGGSRSYVRRAVDRSLRRLATDHIDLYQMHQPDPGTPIDETLSALDDLVHEGKVRYLGNSNFAGWQIADAHWVARTEHMTRFVTAQNRYNLLERGAENEVIPACERFALGLLPFYPLASGLLTGKYQRGARAPDGTRLALPAYADRLQDPAAFDVVEGLSRFAASRGVRLLDVAIGGLAAQPCVSSVIAGATRVDQVVANAAAGVWEPSAEDLAEIDRITGRGR